MFAISLYVSMNYNDVFLLPTVSINFKNDIIMQSFIPGDILSNPSNLHSSQFEHQKDSSVFDKSLVLNFTGVADSTQLFITQNFRNILTPLLAPPTWR